jgi:predicted Rdx family selenoprotein
VPKYLIERQIPGAGALTQEQLQQISSRSNSVLATLGPDIQWVQSYVTPDAIYCVYIAANEQIVRDHASRGGFPATRITQIKQMIDPTTSEGPVAR